MTWNNYILLRLEEYDMFGVVCTYPIGTTESRQSLITHLRIFYEASDDYKETFTLPGTGLEFSRLDLCGCIVSKSFRPPLILTVEEWFDEFVDVTDNDKARDKYFSLVGE